MRPGPRGKPSASAERQPKSVQNQNEASEASGREPRSFRRRGRLARKLEPSADGGFANPAQESAFLFGRRLISNALVQQAQEGLGFGLVLAFMRPSGCLLRTLLGAVD
jgi:hypothetical protein